MTGQESPRSRRKQGTDERMLQAAMKVFGQRGYSSGTLTQIARLANVTQGLVSQRFASKGGLLKDTLAYATHRTQLDSIGLVGPAPDCFYILLNALERMLHTDQTAFEFFAMINKSIDLPQPVEQMKRSGFENSPFLLPMQAAQEDGLLPAGDLYDLYRSFLSNAFSVMGNEYRFGLHMTSREFYLLSIGYTYTDQDVLRQIGTDFNSKLMLGGRNRHLAEDSAAIAQAMQRSYYAMFLLDMADDSYQMVKNSELMSQIVPVSGQPGSAQTTINRCVNAVVRENYRPAMMQMLDLSTITERFAYRDILSADYVNIRGDWCRCQLIPVYRDKAGCVTKLLLGLQTIAGEADYLKMLRSSKTSVQALTKLYLSSYYININEDRMEALAPAADPMIEDAIGSGGTASVKLQDMCRLLVKPEYAPMMRDFCDFSTLQKRLADHDHITCAFESTRVGRCEGIFQVAERDSEGRCIHALWVTRPISGQCDSQVMSLLDEQLYTSAASTVYPSCIIENCTTGMMHAFEVNGSASPQVSLAQGARHLVQTVPSGVERDRFIGTFSRASMRQAWAEGRRRIVLRHPRMGENGSIRWWETIAMLSKNEHDDLIAVVLMRCMDPLY